MAPACWTRCAPRLRSDVVLASPRALLRLQGAATLAGALALYSHEGYSWILFAALILAPDVSFVGYLAGARVGAAAYNLVHNVVLPIAVGVYGVAGGVDAAVAVALVWIAHIGMDRAVGYGLKYPTDFKDTHLQRV